MEIYYKKYGQYTNDTCGGHIHIGADYFKSPKAYQNLLDIWNNNEELFYIISNKEGTIPRPELGMWAEPISKGFMNADFQIDEKGNLEDVKAMLANFQNDRNHAINFKNLNVGEKQTIEFRLSNGTVEPDVWIENVNLFGGLVATAQKLATIQEKLLNAENVSEDENKLINIFNRLKSSEELTLEERLRLLLELVIEDENDREIYINRYNKNVALFKNSEAYAMLKAKIARHEIAIRCFTDIKLPEFNEAEKIVRMEEQNRGVRNK